MKDHAAKLQNQNYKHNILYNLYYTANTISAGILITGLTYMEDAHEEDPNVKGTQKKGGGRGREKRKR